MFDKCPGLCASVAMVNLQPLRFADLIKWLGKSSLSGLALISNQTFFAAANDATRSKSKG
jgi:hypothetical protein